MAGLRSASLRRADGIRVLAKGEEFRVSVWGIVGEKTLCPPENDDTAMHTEAFILESSWGLGGPLYILVDKFCLTIVSA
jgi:hypothetical protein